MRGGPICQTLPVMRVVIHHQHKWGAEWQEEEEEEEMRPTIATAQHPHGGGCIFLCFNVSAHPCHLKKKSSMPSARHLKERPGTRTWGGGGDCWVQTPPKQLSGRGILEYLDLEADLKAHRTPGGSTMASLRTLHVSQPCHVRRTPEATRGVQPQILTPTSPKLFGPCGWWGGGGAN